MARFEPFAGIRYDLDRSDLGRVIAPPYDVIDAASAPSWPRRDPHNAVLIDLPSRPTAPAATSSANQRLQAWQADGVLVTDERPSFTIYRMTATDDAGVERHTTGVIGALELSPPGTDILPHEHTTQKAKSDRLDLLRSCRANLSAIWGLSLAKGLTDLLPWTTPPLADVVDDDGVRHTVWRVDDPATCAAIAAAVAEQPVVVADGHHRYETSLAYKGEREAADGDAGWPAPRWPTWWSWSRTSSPSTPSTGSSAGCPTAPTWRPCWRPWFEEVGPPPEGAPITAAMAEEGCLDAGPPGPRGVPTSAPDKLAEARDLDSSRLDVALAHFPDTS